MTHQVLALKLRPQTFEQIIGQDAVVKTLKNAITADRIPHAFIFSGIRGVGKTSTARILAKALNCKEGPTTQPCNKCTNCKEISLGYSVDVIELDAASNRGIDEIRDIRSKVKYSPLASKYKIYILDEAHMLTTQAFNALLKTLEEPPPYIVFILSTTEFHKFPATIISRCQHFDFRRIPHNLILEHLRKIADEEKVKAEDASLALIATAAEGSLRDAQRSFDQIISFSGKEIQYDDVVSMLGIISHEMLLSITKALLEQQIAELLKLIDKLINYGYEPHQICHQLIGHLRNLLIFKVTEEPKEMISFPEEEYLKLQNQAASFSKIEIMRRLDMLLHEEKEIRYSSQSRFQLESLLIRMALLHRLLPVDELITKIEHLENKLKSSGAAITEKESIPQAQRTSSEPELFSPTITEKKIEEDLAVEEVIPSSEEPSVEESGEQYEVTPQESSLKEQILAAIKKEKPPLFQLINFADSISIENEALILTFAEKNGTHKELLEEKSKIEQLKQIATQVAQKKIDVKIISGEGEEEVFNQTIDDTKESKKEELEKRILKQPKVKDFIKKFEGKIIDIEDLKKKH